MFQQQPNYIPPAGPPGAYKTYSISSPIETHTRPGTCEDAGCLANRHGWKTTIDVSTGLGKRQHDYIESKVHGRHFTVEWTSIDMVTYTFPAGQVCFAAPHQVALERPAFFLVKDGDYRGNPFGTRPVRRDVDDWVDDFANHQQALHDRIERG
jgi:hypothetical protein